VRTPRRSSGNRRHNKERRIFIFIVRRNNVRRRRWAACPRASLRYTFSLRGLIRNTRVIMLLFNYYRGNYITQYCDSNSMRSSRGGEGFRGRRLCVGSRRNVR